MYRIELKNCNNIKDGGIKIEAEKLNIKYGINGTGKTTLAKAIQFSADNEKLQSLQSYFTEEPANITIAPNLQKILVFNEDFVNRVVVVQDEVIENSFEVFLKTSDYDVKKEQLDNHLRLLRGILYEDSEITALKNTLNIINTKFKRTASGNIKKVGAMKSLLAKQNIYNVPKELEIYRPFFDDKNINISWIDWKNKGDDFDITKNCPYCSEEYNIPKHTMQKEVFKNTYNKADSQNLKDILELFEELKSYLKRERYEELIGYIKEDTPEDIIVGIIDKLTMELDVIVSRFNLISEFGNKKIAIADISNLEQEIIALEIPKGFFEIFGGEKTEAIFDRVNEKVSILKAEVILLKKEMGQLKGFVLATVRASQNDINEFLKTAGINYELEIYVEDETNSKTILRQCFTEERTDVKNIREHLSWGEKNAFALILFLYYIQTQNADLIILDDPVSSFDSNKKYAILHRLFKNIGKKDVSLDGKTVLLLTHDFEPITDFIVVGKLSSERAVASFIWNEEGHVDERVIDPIDDIWLIGMQCEKIAKMIEVNIVSRVAFLRKLCELNGKVGEWGNAYEILSSLVHASPIRRKVGIDDYVTMDPDDIDSGKQKIKEYISDFDCEYLKDNVYTIEGVKRLYNVENNAYLKIQLFRAICELKKKDEMHFTPFDEGWYKFIDETYHIENDYLHYLDIIKFNVVPNYISKKVDDMMSKL